MRLRETSGQGGAFRQVGATRIAAFTVVNAMGAIINRRGEVVRGNRDEKTRKRCHSREYFEQRLADAKKVHTPRGNTTLTLVVTNQRMGFEALGQFAWQVHASMARAIHPFHTKDDGDILYAVTNEVRDRHLDETALGA